MFTKELTAKWEKSPSVRWRFKDKFHNAWNTLSFIKISWHPSISNEWKNMDVPGMCVWQGKRLCFFVCLFSEKKWLFNCYYEYQAWFLYISQFVWCMVIQIHEHVLQQCEITCMCYFWLENFFTQFILFGVLLFYWWWWWCIFQSYPVIFIASQTNFISFSIRFLALTSVT